MATHLINLALALLFLSLMAQLSIRTPEALGGIPITGQSLAVLLVGLLLPAPYGGVAVVLYVLLGALGLPIYAEARSGWEVLRAGSGGFLIGFIPAAFLLGYLRKQGWGAHLGWSLLANLIGTGLIVGCGLIGLARLHGWARALDYGLYPFVEGAVAKIFIGGFIAWSLLRRSGSS